MQGYSGYVGTIVLFLFPPSATNFLFLKQQVVSSLVTCMPDAVLCYQVLESSSQAAMAPVPRTGGMQTRITIQHPSGVSISVVEGDITQMNVDTIVNAANNRMDHVGGLARDIVQKGIVIFCLKAVD